MFKINYLDNLHNMCIEMNQYAFHYGDGKAWDNKKMKVRKRQCPRGKAFRRLEAQEYSREFSDMIKSIEGLSELLCQ